MSFIYFFVFKKKTAYDMRISDWSSDVCSSDLLDTADLGARLREKQSNLDSARSALNLAAINREKAATLAKSGYKSQTALDEAENTWRTARANETGRASCRERVCQCV